MKNILFAGLILTAASSAFWASALRAQEISSPLQSRLEVTGYISSPESFVISTDKEMNGKLYCEGENGLEGQDPVLDLFTQSSFAPVARYKFHSPEKCQRTSDLIRKYAGSKATHVRLTLNEREMTVTRVEAR